MGAENGDNDPKIPRIPWKGPSPDVVEFRNRLGSLARLQQDREKAERILATADYIAHLNSLAQAHEILGADKPEQVIARFRSLAEPADKKSYGEQELAYAHAFLILTG